MKNTFFLVGIVLLAGCGGGGSSDSAGRNISDIRFNGEFEYVFDYISTNGINETHLKDTLIFNGTTIASNIRYKKNYNTSSGWTYTGNYIGDSLRRNIEFEVTDNRYRYRVYGADNLLNLWGSDSNQWSNWNEFNFDTSGNILSLNGSYASNAFGYSSITLVKRGYYPSGNDAASAEVRNLIATVTNTFIDGSKEYEISWNFSGIPQVRGISYDFNGSNNSSTTMSPLPTSTSITLNSGEVKIFNIKTISASGFSVGQSLTLSN